MDSFRQKAINMLKASGLSRETMIELLELYDEEAEDTAELNALEKLASDIKDAQREKEP
jgi:hypothetical protein